MKKRYLIISMIVVLGLTLVWSPVEAQCGDGTCDSSECNSCYTDCGPSDCCGNGTCDSGVGEDEGNCPDDCSAGPVCEDGMGICIENPLGYSSLSYLVRRIVSFFYIIGIPLSILMTLIGAFFMLTSGGDPRRIEKGKKVIMYAAIGFALILFTWGLMSFLNFVLTG